MGTINIISNSSLAKSILTGGEVLTIAKAEELKNRAIQCSFHGYEDNKPYVMEFIVGDIVAADIPGYDYGFFLYTAEGENTYIFTEKNEDVFFCTDIDRAVFFKIVK